MSDSMTAPEARPAILRSYLTSFVEGRASLKIKDTEIDLSDLHDDTRSFLTQAERARDRGLMDFPCVATTQVDRRGERFLIRFVPLDFREVSPGTPAITNEDFKVEAEKAEARARERGLPVTRAPLDEARRGFFEGIIDTIVARSNWFRLKSQSQSMAFGTTDPKVTVTTTPDQVDVSYSTGHYFSTALIFGTTNVTGSVKAGTYCFWRTSEVPHTGMGLRNIQQDTPVKL